MSKRDWILVFSIVGCILIALLCFRFLVGWFYVIPGNDMYPSLPAGSRVFVWHRPYADVSQVTRGDIVLFEREENGQRFTGIGRVIGLPGDVVLMNGDNLSLNGEEVVRELLHADRTEDVYRETCAGRSYDVAFGPPRPTNVLLLHTEVPADHLFVMGDNRRTAVDSRSFGPISFDSITGKTR